MTRDKDQGHKVSQSWGRSSGQQAPKAADLSLQISQHLRNSEAVIAELKRELASYREQNLSLAKERNDLIKLLSQSKLIQTEDAETGAKWHTLRAEQERMQATLGAVRQENMQLKSQCAELQQSMLTEQSQTAEAQEVISCLEEQVQQLQDTVDLLFLHLELLAKPSSGA